MSTVIPEPSRGRSRPWSLALLAALSLLAPSAAAQERVPLGEEPVGAARRSDPGGRLNVELGVASVYDTNIEHRTDPLAAFGVVTRGDVLYRDRVGSATYWIEGGLALHSYSATDRYNRVSKVASGRIEVPMSRALRAGLLVQLALAGTSEDRVVNDQLAISPRVIRTFGDGGLARLWTALRFRRSQDGEHTGTNRYLALYLRTAGSGRPHAELTTRYEVNRPDLPENRFGRWMHEIGYSVPLASSTSLAAELQYITQRYDQRELDADVGAPTGTVRQDRRWSPGLTLTHEVADLEIALEYDFDTRDSNDPDRTFRSHSLRLDTTYRW